MASKPSTSPSSSSRLKCSKKPKPKKQHSELNEPDSLKWNSSLPTDEDPFSSELLGAEGGFLSLEEIDESEYGLVFPDSKKQKREVKDGGVEVKNQEKEGKKKKNKKKNKKKIAKVSEEGPTNSNSPRVSSLEEVKDGNEVEGESLFDETEFYAWNELRLQPLLMKSIHKLGFKEPTPIQKACIPAAAHQGKVVIGAAETGSGKTIAFGLPLLQRLHEEWEKAANTLTMKGNGDGSDVQETPIRALIVTPTRELALQVADHLKAVTKFTNIKVVPIVGGMSMEKQERLLKYRPEIVVGAPGRLWELTSQGEEHLVNSTIVQ